MKGFLRVCPREEWGAKMYMREKKGNSIPILTISIPCRIIFFRRKPGRPSYQIDASSCWTLGCATNYNKRKVKISLQAESNINTFRVSFRKEWETCYLLYTTLFHKFLPSSGAVCLADEPFYKTEIERLRWVFLPSSGAVWRLAWVGWGAFFRRVRRLDPWDHGWAAPLAHRNFVYGLIRLWQNPGIAFSAPAIINIYLLASV